MDDRPDSKYLKCLFHYSVSVKASAGSHCYCTVSAVLAGQSMALKRNSEEFIAGGRCTSMLFLLTCTLGSRYYQRQTSEVPVDRTS